MIQFRKLSIARGARRLIAEADLQIHTGRRVGLTGANGSGKSSLFALLRGELQAEHGDCTLPPSWRIASVAQETPALDREAIEYVLDGDHELRALQADLAGAEAASMADGTRLAELHARLDDIGGYSAQARAAALLSGLGFAEADHRRAVKTFSGGWRMRLNLAQALVSRADLLLLDEPTNHLDLDAVVWLERWLAAFRGTLLIVSHDREFLDGCVTHIAHIENAELRLSTGNYSAFEEARAARLAAQQAMYEKQQRVIAHMESYVERFRAKATKARQAQSRLKALARLERIAAAHVDTPFSFSFPPPEKSPNALISLENISCAYGQRTILSGLDLQLRPGARIGLLGANGAGKSTLMKLLAGETAPASGRRGEGKDLAIGYFAQHQLEQLRGDESPLRHLLREEPATREQDLRDYLGGFDFRGSMADATVQNFSGGEKSRLALALLIRRRPNLLLLDEPTNHLDLEMRQALTAALAEYEGSLVLVSHDRALLRAVCDEFLLVADGRVETFDGSVDDYIEWLSARRSAATGAAAGDDKARRRDARESAAAERQARLAARRPLVKESTQLESDLARWQQEKQSLDQRLADPALYAGGDSSAARELGAQQQALAQAIKKAELRWLELQEALEAIGEA
ncbi:MAG: ATP-binding cassette domain-containing protein [Betaproteobacteria bacterium]|nr:ATP-binding cassette domain-containing protein [Betaproteobacteria bacterium]